ncbi:hypothetical protein EJ08DRAFT_278930 [Tothia fuscella]|uniref:Uncharacterized protein n=1 Tax=Tothia fuscella TaxID=1048955 RepID=A0A9P4NQ44_9PEZI|nr:hypothetical protein EJ08DRAFT_278930 [Tothia fuscella]
MPSQFTFANEKFGVISNLATLFPLWLKLWQLPLRAWRESACIWHQKLRGLPFAFVILSSGSLMGDGVVVQPWEPMRRLCAFMRHFSAIRSVLDLVLLFSESGLGKAQFDSDYSGEDDASIFYLYGTYSCFKKIIFEESWDTTNSNSNRLI